MSSNNRHKFNDYEEQELISTHFAMFRMQGPAIGRFWSHDPIVKPWSSPFSFAANNPINYVDYLGLDPQGGSILYNPRKYHRTRRYYRCRNKKNSGSSGSDDERNQDIHDQILARQRRQYQRNRYNKVLNQMEAMDQLLAQVDGLLNSPTGGIDFWSTYAGQDIAAAGNAIKEFFTQDGGIVQWSSDESANNDALKNNTVRHEEAMKDFSISFSGGTPKNIYERAKDFADGWTRVWDGIMMMSPGRPDSTVLYWQRDDFPTLRPAIPGGGYGIDGRPITNPIDSSNTTYPWKLGNRVWNGY